MITCEINDFQQWRKSIAFQQDSQNTNTTSHNKIRNITKKILNDLPIKFNSCRKYRDEIMCFYSVYFSVYFWYMYTTK